MTIERFNQVRDYFLKQVPAEPPVNSSEFITVMIYAEHWIHFANDIREPVLETVRIPIEAS